MVCGEETMDIKDMKRQGLTITRIAEITGRDLKTVRKYLKRKEPPKYASRPPVESKLDEFKSYIEKRMVKDSMTNAVKMLKEIKRQGYTGGITVLRVYMHPFRPIVETTTRRYETNPGAQAQVDWGHCGRIFHLGEIKPLKP